MPFSIRLHNSVLPDQDRNLHDHPFNFRSIVIDGGYSEVALLRDMTDAQVMAAYGTHALPDMTPDQDTVTFMAAKHYVHTGATYAAMAQRWHRIDQVYGATGAWSIFIMGRRRQTWGFLVKGEKVPWREYLRAHRG